MGEGDEDVGEDDGGVGVGCGDDDGPGGVPAPPGERGRGPFFFFFFFLDLLPRCGSPSEIGSVSLSLSVFLYSRRSVTLIGLKFGHDFYPDIGFLVAKEGHQPPYGLATRAQGAPLTLVGPSGIVSR